MLATATMEGNWSGTADEPTNAEMNRAIVRNSIEILLNRRNLAAAPLFWADDLVVHLPGKPQPLRGREVAIERLFSRRRAAFPDMRIAVEELIAEGDLEAAHWTTCGTHQGSYLGLSPTGKAVVVREIWLMPDALGTLRQLGAIWDVTPPRPLGRMLGVLRRLADLRERIEALNLYFRWLRSRQ